MILSSEAETKNLKLLRSEAEYDMPDSMHIVKFTGPGKPQTCLRFQTSHFIPFQIVVLNVLYYARINMTRQPYNMAWAASRALPGQRRLNIHMLTIRNFCHYSIVLLGGIYYALCDGLNSWLSRQPSHTAQYNSKPTQHL